MARFTHGCILRLLRIFLFLNGECSVHPEQTFYHRKICTVIARVAKCFYWTVVSIYLALSGVVLAYSTVKMGILTFIEYSRYVFPYEAALLILIIFTCKQTVFHQTCVAWKECHVTIKISEKKWLFRWMRMHVEVLFAIFYAVNHFVTQLMMLWEYSASVASLTAEVNYFAVFGFTPMPLWAWQCLSYPLTAFCQLLASCVLALFCVRIYGGIAVIQSVKQRKNVENTDNIRLDLLKFKEYLAAVEDTFSNIFFIHIGANSLAILSFVQSFSKPGISGSAAIVTPLFLIACFLLSMLIPVFLIIRLQDKVEVTLDTLLATLERPQVNLSAESVEQTESLRSFLRSLRLMPPRLTGGKFFVIDRGLIAAMIGFFATYAVLVKEILKDSTGKLSLNATRSSKADAL